MNICCCFPTAPCRGRRADSRRAVSHCDVEDGSRFSQASRLAEIVEGGGGVPKELAHNSSSSRRAKLLPFRAATSVLRRSAFASLERCREPRRR